MLSFESLWSSVKIWRSIVIITAIMITKFIDWQGIPCTGTSSIRGNLGTKDS